MSMEEHTGLRVQAGENFVVTPAIEAVCTRALAYLEAGYAVHLSGPAGTGKTTLAMHIAALRTRPVMLIYGDEEFGTSNLVGGEKGVLSKKLVDNFIRSVYKSEESVRSVWVDQRLTTACKHGHTLVYDEFSRSRPEANNVLLSILEEKLMILPNGRYGEGYVQVHPDFRAIFTSNPEEYVGVHKTQDALLDRMITIELTPYDKGTEAAITQARSGLSAEEAGAIMELVREFREIEGSRFRPSVRACIMIAKVTRGCGGQVRPDNPIFRETCLDILCANARKMRREEIKQLIQDHCHRAVDTASDEPAGRKSRDSREKGSRPHPNGIRARANGVREHSHNAKSHGQVQDQDPSRRLDGNGKAQPGAKAARRGNGALGAAHSAD
ncbi:MAG TPA: gas vesicle protein GvpN [Candidatus Binatia bacterium]|nr:gas vesicle protein GvpN [Candidatus Binatia bacterium]